MSELSVISLAASVVMHYKLRDGSRRTDCAYAADTYFPDLDEMPEWKLVKESEEETYFDIEYQFLVYQK